MAWVLRLMFPVHLRFPVSAKKLQSLEQGVISCSQCGLVADNLRYSAPWRQGLSALIGESPTKASGFTSKSDRNGTWSQNSAFDF